MRQMNAWRRTLSQAGKGAMPMAAGLGAAILLPAKAFMEAEDAAIGLKNTLMTSNGLVPGFKELSAIAVQLGNQLPGTTADFSHMATVMKSNGLATQSMINGGLKAAAYLAISTEGLGETYDSAALGIAKISNVFGVADKDLVALADTMQRVVNLGVGIEPFTSAMSKAGGAMKAVRQGGIEAAKSMAPLISLLVRSGVDPSEAGTGIKKLISVTGGAGKFKNIEGMVEGLEKLYKLDPAKLIKTFKEVFGEEHGGKAIIIAAGGYKQITAEMKNQADLDMRVQESLKSLSNLWGAATGTFTNAMVAFSTAYAPELKDLADSINKVAGNLQDWCTNNGPVIKMAIETAGAFVGMKVAFYAASVALGVLNTVAKTNPFLLIAQGLAIAAPYIYEHWSEITTSIKDAFNTAITWITDKWTNFVDGIIDSIAAIKSAWQGAKNFFSGTEGTPLFPMNTPSPVIPKEHKALQLSASNILPFKSQQVIKDHGMRPPGFISPKQKTATIMPFISSGINNDIEKRSFITPEKRKQISDASRVNVQGGIDININNAPPGTRVTQSPTRGPIRIKPNVGYRSFANGSNY